MDSQQLPARGGGWRVQRARELYERTIELQQVEREAVMDIAEVLREVKEGGFWKEMEFSSFEAYALAAFGLERSKAYRLLQIAENVIAALPEWAGAVLVGPSDKSANPLPLKVLAALHFDQVSPAQIEKVRLMEPEQQKAELLKLGYDREKMGGRAASDLLRPYVSRKTGRDQSHKLQLEREKSRTLKAEIAEMQEAMEALKRELEQTRETLRADDKVGAMQRQLDAMAGKLAEFQKLQAEGEARIATGKDVQKRALVFLGEITVICQKLFDETRVDDRAGWLAVWNAVDAAEKTLHDTRGEMAANLIARAEAGEVKLTEEEIADPSGMAEAAEEGLRPGTGRSQKSEGRR